MWTREPSESLALSLYWPVLSLRHTMVLCCQDPIMLDFPRNKIYFVILLLSTLSRVHHCAVLALKCLQPSEDAYVKDTFSSIPSFLEIRQVLGSGRVIMIYEIHNV